MKKTVKTILMAGIAGIIPAALLTQATAQQQPHYGQGDAQELQQRLNAIESEYVEVATKINNIEQQALDDKQVADARDKFETRLDRRMLEMNPDLEAMLKERQKYSKYIDKVQAGRELPSDVDVNEVYANYNAIQQEIIPVRQQAIEHQEVRTAYNQYQEKLVSKMQEIDSGVTDYIRKQNELIAEYQNLISQAQQQGG